MNLVKESLAKLLAQEDLIVEHRKVDTAQFNVETRVLTLPMWQHDSNLVIDMLIAHEVGHALYTPNRWDFVNEVPLSFVNVTEDVRIEKLMKRRYEGLPKTFFGGYNVLAEEDFFQVEDVNWDVLNIADKVNLHYKIGNFIDVPFNSDEAVFRDDALHLETFEDAIELAKRMHAYAKEQIEQRKQQQQEEEKIEAMEVPVEGRPDLGEDNTEYPLEDLSTGKTPQEPTEEGEGVEAEKAEPESVGGKEAGRGNGPSGAQYSADEVQTADTLAEAIEDLAQTNTSVTEYSYIELPEKVSSKTFVSNQEVSDYIEQYYASKENLSVDPDEFVDEYDYRMAQYTTQVLREADKEYNQYKKEAQKEVSYLVKEFEMKKAADGYARQTISRTGVLNTGLLHTYKYNDDIFRKITTIPDAKSHGLIFNIDWSGSMSNALAATIKQVLSLVSFCRKVGIAYDVYSFTDAYETSDRYAYKEDPKFKNKVICRNFNMVNLLTSKSNNRTHAKQAKNLYRIAASFCNRSGGVPQKMGLGGTPLDESMIAMNEIIPAFKKKTGAQKVHVVNLTDGEGYGISYGQMLTSDYSDEQHVVARRIGSRTRLRDRQTGQTYQFDDDNYGHTKTFVTLLRNRFPECSFMNIRLCNGGDWSRFKRECLGYDNPEGYAKADAQWKKTKSFICTSSAYTVQYALSIGALSNDAEFEVVEDATKAQIRSAFKKSLNAKKMNKKILSSFIDQIA
tara:strand:+ start:266 stop:2461 length:2196 start_codon:yes stop_codon:yes gene_type:complete